MYAGQPCRVFSSGQGRLGQCCAVGVWVEVVVGELVPSKAVLGGHFHAQIYNFHNYSVFKFYVFILRYWGNTCDNSYYVFYCIGLKF